MPRFSRWLWFLVGLVAALLALPTHAAMQLDRNVVYFDSSEADRQDVLIRNPEADTMYLEVDLHEVLRPGAADEERIRILDPRSMELLVTPNKLVIPAGGQKLLRFVHLGDRDEHERVFRATVTPKLPELRPHRSAIKVLVAYEVLVIVSPDDQRHDLVADRVGGALELQNLGNSNVLLYRGVQCADAAQLDAPDEGDCRSVRGTRLYAGNRWRPDLPYGTPVEFIVKSSGRNQRQRF